MEHKEISQKHWREIADNYPNFTYNSYHYEIVDNDLVIEFSFAIEGLVQFTPKATIKHINRERFADLPKPVIDNLVFHLGLIESFSYWKATAAQYIHIKCGNLNSEQVHFWQDLLVNGMGEYMYMNQIDRSYMESVQFLAKEEQVAKALYEAEMQNSPIVPVGGGKDSAVTAELFRQAGIEFKTFLLNPIEASVTTAEVAGDTAPIRVVRVIDQKLLDLNAEGYLNGHTPFSAYLAFLAVLCGVLFDYRDIALSNERSANQGNATYEGKVVNHQYSKTFDFEKKFHLYTKTYLSKNTRYFSFLRPLYELQIAKLFSRFPMYFAVFRSCNVNQKLGTWCGKCPKCLFTYIMLYPFIGKDECVAIFERDLFTDQSLQPILEELLGLTQAKPFECVGTYEEIRVALYLSQNNVTNDQVLLQYFADKIMPDYSTLPEDADYILKSWNDEHLLVDRYIEILSSQVAYE